MLVVWVALLAFLMLGCTPSAPPPEPPKQEAFHDPPPVPSPNRKFAGTTLTYYGERSGSGVVLEEKLLKRFTEDTGINVTYIPRPQSASECYAAYQRLFQAQTADVDLMMVDIIWPAAFAQHLVDLTPHMNVKGILPQMIASATVDGQLVAMPGYQSAGMLFYRTDLLQKYGFDHPPKTWDELESMSRTIQEGERKTNRRFVGFVWQGYTYEGLTCNALEWQVSHDGGAIFDAEGHVQVQTPGARQAFLRAAAWIGTISPPGVTGYQEEDVRHVFEGGNAAFMRHWPYCVGSGNEPHSLIRGKFDVTTLPGNPPASTLGAWLWAISRYSQHQEAALELVRYETCPEVQLWRAIEGAFLPTRMELYEEPSLLEKMPFCKTMPAIFRSTVLRPSLVTKDLYNEASSIYYQGVAEILQGGDADTALAKMDRDLKELMQP